MRYCVLVMLIISIRSLRSVNLYVLLLFIVDGIAPTDIAIEEYIVLDIYTYD